MEVSASMDNSHPQIHPSVDGPSSPHSDFVPDPLNANGGGRSGLKLSTEEVKKELEIIASTGKFWHDWEELQNMIDFQLKQVLSGYPEATMSDDQQYASLGESYSQLVKRLEEALFRFTDGPPFTLQRLCEILLDARTMYPNLSKLALALEKTLLVTSTLTKSTDPYQPSISPSVEQVQDTHLQPQHEPETQNERPDTQQLCPDPQPPHSHTDSVENGEELITRDRDEVMTDADAKADEGMAIDVETFEEIISSSDANPEPPSD